MYSINIFILHFTYLGGAYCIRTQRTHLHTGLFNEAVTVTVK